MSPGSAPCVTSEQLDAAITGKTYTVLPDGRTTICQLTLYNGFTVIGKSACVSAENFDPEAGRRIARENAKNELWQLLGFCLAERLYQEKLQAPATEDGAQTNPAPAKDASERPLEIGDQLHFYEKVGDQLAGPLLALVASVVDERHASLAVFAPNGTAHARQNVTLLGPQEEAPVSLNFFARHKH